MLDTFSAESLLIPRRALIYWKRGRAAPKAVKLVAHWSWFLHPPCPKATLITGRIMQIRR